MDGWRTKRPSPSMAVAMLALFVALTGVATAGKSKTVKLKANSVKSKHIAPGAVGPSDLAPQAVTDVALADNAVRARSIRPGEVTDGKLGPASVDEQNLENSTVSPAKIAASPGASAEQTVATTVGGSSVQLAFNTQVFDFLGDMWRPTDPAKMRAPIAGVYQVTAGVTWAAGETGSRKITLVAETANPLCTCEFDSSTTPVAASGTTAQSLTSVVKLDAGDKVWVAVDSEGDDGSTDVVNSPRPRLTMTWIGPAQ
jgi:hypothetical protein